jgi:diguanylate cyclase (GGDEF)-like protein
MLKSMSKSLRAKFTLLLLLVGLLPLAVGSLFSVVISRNAILERQRLEMGQEVSDAAKTVESLLEKVRFNLLLMARDGSFQGYFTETGRKEFWLRDIQEAFRYIHFLFPKAMEEGCFIRSDGREICKIIRGDLADSHELEDEYNKEFFKLALALSEGQTYQGEPYISSDTQRWVIPTATPIVLRNGDKAGLIHFELSLKYLQETLHVRVQDGSSIFIVNDEGDLVLHTDYPVREGEPFVKALAQDPSPSYQGVIRKMMQGERGFERFTADGSDHYVAFLPIQLAQSNPNHWRIGIMIPAHAIHTGKGILTTSAILFLVTLTGVVLMSYWIGRAVAQPIKTLVTATEKVARGDLGEEIRFESRDELGILARSFNEMVDGLRQREEFRSLNQELNELVITDGLTGLYNHRYFQDRLSEEIQRSVRTNKPFALLFCDLDYFKSFNDLNGHHLGDKALKAISQVIKNTKRAMDIAARYGGEEFTVILPETDGPEAKKVAERLRKEVEMSGFETRHHVKYHLTVSIGIAVYPQDGITKEELLERADLMMYYAKCLGRNQVHLYEEARGSDSLMTQDHVDRDGVFMNALRFMASMVEEKDHYTHSHSESVTGYAVSTARALGLNRTEMYHVGLGALLHDLGKIGISDEILSKKGPLSLEEMARIRSYPLIGAEILKRSTNFQQVMPMVLHHRERYDGQGYPGQLRGDAIPIGARIIAVVDAYYAMLSERPYRRAMAEDKAIAELRRCAGTQFDPRVVEAFVRCLETATHIPSYKDLPFFSSRGY